MHRNDYKQTQNCYRMRVYRMRVCARVCVYVCM